MISAFSYEPSRAPRASSFSAQSVNDEEPGRKHKIWQTPGFRSPRQGPQRPFQWIADLYTFGGILSRLDQATDRCAGSQAVFNYQAFAGDADQLRANPMEAARPYHVLECGGPRCPRRKVFHRSCSASMRAGRDNLATSRSWIRLDLLLNQANDRIRN